MMKQCDESPPVHIAAVFGTRYTMAAKGSSETGPLDTLVTTSVGVNDFANT